MFKIEGVKLANAVHVGTKTESFLGPDYECTVVDDLYVWIENKKTKLKGHTTLYNVISWNFQNYDVAKPDASVSSRGNKTVTEKQPRLS